MKFIRISITNQNTNNCLILLQPLVLIHTSEKYFVLFDNIWGMDLYYIHFKQVFKIHERRVSVTKKEKEKIYVYILYM